MNTVLSHSSPEEWGEKTRALGCSSTVFPVDYRVDLKLIDAYAKAAEQNDLVIAEVGVWCSPLADNIKARMQAQEKCREQLKLADYVGAKCCVNVSGAAGERWDGPYRENFTQEFYDRVVESVCKIIDDVQPKNTCYSIEPMPWMIPAGPGDYEKLLRDVNREHFAVHMDLANWISSPKRYFSQEKFVNKVFKRLGSKIKSCHLKDVHLSQEYTFRMEEVPCGEGELNLEYIADKINKTDPELPVLIEHLHSEQEYISSFQYLKKRLQQAGLL